MSRLTFRGHKGYGLLKGKSCSYASHSFGCQLDEGVKLLDAAFEKLTKYEDLEEQGRLIELPCKVGDIVYAPIDFENKILTEDRRHLINVQESNNYCRMHGIPLRRNQPLVEVRNEN